MLGTSCSCSIGWTLDGFSHCSLHRYHLWRGPLFSGHSCYYNFLTNKPVLFIKDVHWRTSFCTFRYGQGCADGVIIDTKRELAAGSSLTMIWLNVPSSQGICAAQHSPKAVWDGQHSTAQHRPGHVNVNWCGALTPPCTMVSWSEPRHSTPWQNLPFSSIL